MANRKKGAVLLRAPFEGEATTSVSPHRQTGAQA